MILTPVKARQWMTSTITAAQWRQHVEPHSPRHYLCQWSAKENHCHLRCLPIQFAAQKFNPGALHSCRVSKRRKQITKKKTSARSGRRAAANRKQTRLQKCWENSQSCLVRGWWMTRLFTRFSAKSNMGPTGMQKQRYSNSVYMQLFSS